MNWKKMMAVGLAAVSMMAFVTGCGGDTKKANTELPKKVVIGLDDSFPPMGFKDEKGEIVGFDIDMAKEAAKRAGMDVEFKAIDWSSKEAELKSKKIDALWNGLTVSPEREKNILFSNTYMKDKQYVIVPVSYTHLQVELVNDIIYNELCLGVISNESKQQYLDIIGDLVKSGVQGVILGCTEIGLLIKQDDTDIPLFDTTLIHAKNAALISIDRA